MLTLACIAAHPLVGSFAVGDTALLFQHDGKFAITLTQGMLRRISTAIQDGALVIQGGGPGVPFEDIEAFVAIETAALNARIDASLEAAHQRASSAA